MLRFSSRPDPAFAAFLTAALEDEIDHLRNPHVSSRDALVNYSGRTRAILDRKQLRDVLERLLRAHSLPTVYELTSYHLLVLYDVLEIHVDLHNDSLVDHGGARHYGEVLLGEIDFDAVLEHYFLDTDFLMASEILDALGPHEKKIMRFAEGTWGVVRGIHAASFGALFRYLATSCSRSRSASSRLEAFMSPRSSRATVR